MNLLKKMIGCTFDSYETHPSGSDITLLLLKGPQTFRFVHHWDCCEDVRLEDVAGELDDLIGSPILGAEVESNHDNPIKDEFGYYPGSHTWTFYKLRTAKGYVTLRFIGISNGYYSESVDIEMMEPDGKFIDEWSWNRKNQNG